MCLCVQYTAVRSASCASFVCVLHLDWSVIGRGKNSVTLTHKAQNKTFGPRLNVFPSYFVLITQNTDATCHQLQQVLVQTIASTECA